MKKENGKNKPFYVQVWPELREYFIKFVADDLGVKPEDLDRKLTESLRASVLMFMNASKPTRDLYINKVSELSRRSNSGADVSDREEYNLGVLTGEMLDDKAHRKGPK